ncbi:DUF285 domain-containing protein, partial [Campylobacter jejuni]|nr:BspA family leucine-rich repeat surface protein [Campylobacter coli]EFP3712936.1 DUF285 domain-containing protein [Campylobacter jejuni]
DNTMEDLLALKRESFIVEEVKIIKKYKYTPETKEELQALVDNEAIHLGDIDTSKITDMSYLFKRTKRKNFSGIETWNTINVKNMEGMFWGCENFNQDISAWNTSSVENMSCMFLGCENFNQPLNGWDVRNVEYRYGMFYESGMERDDSKKPRFEKE